MASAKPIAARFASGAAVVAGGSGGIGAAICRQLAEGGSHVALTYHRNKDKAEAVAETIRAAGREAQIASIDHNDEAAVAAFVAETAQRFGGVHTAVYAAGPYINMRFVSQIEPKLFRETLSTDLFGCHNLLHACLPHLRKARGAIVAMATPAVIRATSRDILSAAPKAAIEALIKHIAIEEGRFGIRANAVGVGILHDGMYHALKASGDFNDRYMAAAAKNVALGRTGTAEEIADASVFLASDKAAYITGQTLNVDGGYAV
jgi:3-oxoacyl-[acyl-carrier protein] reductase